MAQIALEGGKSMSLYDFLSVYYDELFPPLEAEVGFLAERFGAKRPCTVLDIGCGTGAHVIELCRRGFAASGCDLAESMVAKARARAAQLVAQGELGQAPEFEVEDMTALSAASGSRDACMCIGNTLAHLPSMAAVGTALGQMHRVLRPGGTLVVQTVNFDRVLELGTVDLPDLSYTNHTTGREEAFRRRYEWISNTRALFVSALGPADAPTSEDEVGMCPLLAKALTRAVEQAGFAAVTTYGDFCGGAHALDSPSTILAATKG